MLDGAKFLCLDENGVPCKTIEVKGRKFSIGYLMDCDYNIGDNNEAERIHCQIECDAFGHVTIYNKSEKNPISVNEKVVTIKRTLFNNSKIRILDKEYLWLYKTTASRVDVVSENPDEMSTPVKQIGIPEQPPSSCPTLRYHRDIPQRFTIHNLRAYRIDCEANMTIDNDEFNNQPETSSSQIEAEHSDSQAPSLEVDTTPAKVDLVDSTLNKKTSSTEKRIKAFRNSCGWSGMTATSYSPRETGVRTEKTFTAIIPPKTPRDILCRTPKGLLERLHLQGERQESCNMNLLSFATPTKKPDGQKEIVVQHIKSAMKIVDLTTPSKLRAQSPLATRTLSSKKTTVAAKSFVSFSDNSRLTAESDVAAFSVTPKTTAIDTPTSSASVISVDSTDSSDISEVTDANAVTSTTPLRTPLAGTSSGLRKQVLLASAKKQVTINTLTTLRSQHKTPSNPISLPARSASSTSKSFTTADNSNISTQFTQSSTPKDSKSREVIATAKKNPVIRKLDISTIKRPTSPVSKTREIPSSTTIETKVDKNPNETSEFSTDQFNDQVPAKVTANASTNLATSTPYKTQSTEQHIEQSQLKTGIESFSLLHCSNDGETTSPNKGSDNVSKDTSSNSSLKLTKDEKSVKKSISENDDLMKEIEEILSTSDELRKQLQNTEALEEKEVINEDVFDTDSTSETSKSPMPTEVPTTTTTNTTPSKNSLSASILLKAINSFDKNKSIMQKEDEEKENKVNECASTPARRRISLSTPESCTSSTTTAVVDETDIGTCTPLTPKRITKRRPSILLENDEIPVATEGIDIGTCTPLTPKRITKRRPSILLENDEIPVATEGTDIGTCTPLTPKRITKRRPSTLLENDEVPVATEGTDIGTCTPLTPKRITKRRPSISVDNEELSAANISQRIIDTHNTENMGAIIEEEIDAVQLLPDQPEEALTESVGSNNTPIRSSTQSKLDATTIPETPMGPYQNDFENETEDAPMSPLAFSDESFAEPVISPYPDEIDNNIDQFNCEESSLKIKEQEVAIELVDGQFEKTTNKQINVAEDVTLDESFGEIASLKNISVCPETSNNLTNKDIDFGNDKNIETVTTENVIEDQYKDALDESFGQVEFLEHNEANICEKNCNNIIVKESRKEDDEGVIEIVDSSFEISVNEMVYESLTTELCKETSVSSSDIKNVTESKKDEDQQITQDIEMLNASVEVPIAEEATKSKKLSLMQDKTKHIRGITSLKLCEINAEVGGINIETAKEQESLPNLIGDKEMLQTRNLDDTFEIQQNQSTKTNEVFQLYLSDQADENKIGEKLPAESQHELLTKEMCDSIIHTNEISNDVSTAEREELDSANGINRSVLKETSSKISIREGDQLHLNKTSENSLDMNIYAVVESKAEFQPAHSDDSKKNEHEISRQIAEEVVDTTKIVELVIEEVDKEVVRQEGSDKSSNIKIDAVGESQVEFQPLHADKTTENEKEISREIPEKVFDITDIEEAVEKTDKKMSFQKYSEKSSDMKIVAREESQIELQSVSLDKSKESEQEISQEIAEEMVDITGVEEMVEEADMEMPPQKISKKFLNMSIDVKKELQVELQPLHADKLKVNMQEISRETIEKEVDTTGIEEIAVAEADKEGTHKKISEKSLDVNIKAREESQIEPELIRVDDSKENEHEISRQIAEEVINTTEIEELFIEEVDEKMALQEVPDKSFNIKIDALEESRVKFQALNTDKSIENEQEISREIPEKVVDITDIEEAVEEADKKMSLQKISEKFSDMKIVARQESQIELKPVPLDNSKESEQVISQVIAEEVVNTAEVEEFTTEEVNKKMLRQEVYNKSSIDAVEESHLELQLMTSKELVEKKQEDSQKVSKITVETMTIKEPISSDSLDMNIDAVKESEVELQPISLDESKENEGDVSPEFSEEVSNIADLKKMVDEADREKAPQMICQKLLDMKIDAIAESQVEFQPKSLDESKENEQEISREIVEEVVDTTCIEELVIEEINREMTSQKDSQKSSIDAVEESQVGLQLLTSKELEDKEQEGSQEISKKIIEAMTIKEPLSGEPLNMSIDAVKESEIKLQQIPLDESRESKQKVSREIEEIVEEANIEGSSQKISDKSLYTNFDAVKQSEVEFQSACKNESGENEKEISREIAEELIHPKKIEEFIIEEVDKKMSSQEVSDKTSIDATEENQVELQPVPLDRLKEIEKISIGNAEINKPTAEVSVKQITPKKISEKSLGKIDPTAELQVEMQPKSLVESKENKKEITREIVEKEVDAASRKELDAEEDIQAQLHTAYSDNTKEAAEDKTDNVQEEHQAKKTFAQEASEGPILIETHTVEEPQLEVQSENADVLKKNKQTAAPMKTEKTSDTNTDQEQHSEDIQGDRQAESKANQDIFETQSDVEKLYAVDNQETLQPVESADESKEKFKFTKTETKDGKSRRLRQARADSTKVDNQKQSKMQKDETKISEEVSVAEKILQKEEEVEKMENKAGAVLEDRAADGTVVDKIANQEIISKSTAETKEKKPRRGRQGHVPSIEMDNEKEQNLTKGKQPASNEIVNVDSKISEDVLDALPSHKIIAETKKSKTKLTSAKERKPRRGRQAQAASTKVESKEDEKEAKVQNKQTADDVIEAAQNDQQAVVKEEEHKIVADQIGSVPQTNDKTKSVEVITAKVKSVEKDVQKLTDEAQSRTGNVSDISSQRSLRRRAAVQNYEIPSDSEDEAHHTSSRKRRAPKNSQKQAQTTSLLKTTKEDIDVAVTISKSKSPAQRASRKKLMTQTQSEHEEEAAEKHKVSSSTKYAHRKPQTSSTLLHELLPDMETTQEQVTISKEHASEIEEFVEETVAAKELQKGKKATAQARSRRAATKIAKHYDETTDHTDDIGNMAFALVGEHIIESATRPASGRSGKKVAKATEKADHVAIEDGKITKPPQKRTATRKGKHTKAEEPNDETESLKDDDDTHVMHTSTQQKGTHKPRGKRHAAEAITEKEFTDSVDVEQQPKSNPRRKGRLAKAEISTQENDTTTATAEVAELQTKRKRRHSVQNEQHEEVSTSPPASSSSGVRKPGARRGKHVEELESVAAHETESVPESVTEHTEEGTAKKSRFGRRGKQAEIIEAAVPEKRRKRTQTKAITVDSDEGQEQTIKLVEIAEELSKAESTAGNKTKRGRGRAKQNASTDVTIPQSRRKQTKTPKALETEKAESIVTDEVEHELETHLDETVTKKARGRRQKPVEVPEVVETTKTARSKRRKHVHFDEESSETTNVVQSETAETISVAEVSSEAAATTAPKRRRRR